MGSRFPCRYNERMPGSDERAQSKSFGRLVLYALTFLGVYLSYLVLSPFFVALAWAVMFAILFRGLHAALGSLVAMLFALFFLLRDGAAISRQFRDLLPFPQEESERLMIDTRDLVIASVGAGLIVAAAQGFIGGTAFWLLGIGAPVFWGVVMGFCSLLPIVGAALVWVPAG